VSVWRDKSGNGADAENATGAQQPTYSLTSFFNRPGVLFDGSDDRLTGYTNMFQGNTTHGAYWLCARRGSGNGLDGYRPWISLQQSSDQDAGAWGYRNGSGLEASYPYYKRPNQHFFNNGPSIADNTPYIYAFQQGTSGWQLWRNGVLMGTTNGKSNPDTTVVGYVISHQLVTNNRRSNNEYGEIICVNNTTDLSRWRIEGYLAWKWGFQDSLLSASHIFRNRPPLRGD
jgi:hypothetical protein